jgi:hypothetical protein
VVALNATGCCVEKAGREQSTHVVLSVLAAIPCPKQKRRSKSEKAEDDGVVPYFRRKEHALEVENLPLVKAEAQLGQGCVGRVSVWKR